MFAVRFDGGGCSATTVVDLTPPSTIPPAVSVEDPHVSVAPSIGLRDGQTVTVKVGGFGVGGKVFLSECAAERYSSSLGCGAKLAAQPFIVTNEARAGSVPFVVYVNAPTTALVSNPTERCTSQCVIVATQGGGCWFVVAHISFRG